MDVKSRGTVRVEPGAKRVRAYLAGRLVADTRHPSLVWEVPYYPAYYLPLGEVTAELTPHGEDRALPQPRRRRALRRAGGGRRRRGRGATVPGSPLPAIRGLIRLAEWAAMGEWLEEDEPVYTAPPPPYHRVDILASSRHVRVEVDGVTVADSARPVILFETGLPPRYYLPLTDIRTDLLTPSGTQTHCPYKGTATYWSVDTGHGARPDLVWAYRSPLPESQKIRGLAVLLRREDRRLRRRQERQERPRTHFA